MLDTRSLSTLAGSLVAATALSVLAGWAFEIETLKSVVPGLSTMKANTALAFLLCASALVLGQAGVWPGVARGLALAAVVIGAATLAQYGSGGDLGIDQLLFTATDEQGRTVPGRMSPPTALSFVLFGGALALPARNSPWITGAFLSLTLAGAGGPFAVLTGYLFGVPEVYSPTPYTSMAIHTAVAFLVLFAGIALTRPSTGWVGLLRSAGAGGSVARWLLPAVVVLPLALGWLILQGELAELYQLHTGIALVSVSFVVALAAVVWFGGWRADDLDRARLREEQLHTAVLQNSLDAFILMDSDGRIAEWNPQAEQIFGWSQAEAVGRYLADTIIPERDRANHTMGLKRFLAGGRGGILNRRIELSAMRRSGEEFPVEVVVTPIQLDGERLFSGFVSDISAQRQIESQLRQSQKMEAVGQLTGGVAHDFNNLLTVVIGNLDAALERMPAERRVPVQNALAAAERGAALVQQLLTVSRRQVLAPAPLSLSALVEGMGDLLRRTLGEHVEIEMKLSASLWTAFADKGQVENALLNLAINARDAMPGGGKLTIETENVDLDSDYARRNPELAPGAYVMLAVTDTGTGMPPDVVERAFEPFFTTKDVGKGSGLGLSMVYGFAKQSRGHLKIYSEVGHGTTVKLYLPRAQAADAASSASRASNGEVAATRGEETVLVVEDEEAVRRLAVSQLTDLGYRVIEAANGVDARKHLKSSEPIDLLFTDVVMPGGVSGRALADEAKTIRPKLATLFTSGYTENSIVHQGRLDPNVQFIAKPYRRMELARKVREAIDATK